VVPRVVLAEKLHPGEVQRPVCELSDGHGASDSHYYLTQNAQEYTLDCLIKNVGGLLGLHSIGNRSLGWLGAHWLRMALNKRRLLWLFPALTANLLIECPFIAPMLLNQTVDLAQFGGLVVPLVDLAHELFELCNLGAALAALLGVIT